MNGKYDIDKIIKEAAVADKQKKWLAGYFKRQFQRATNPAGIDDMMAEQEIRDDERDAIVECLRDQALGHDRRYMWPRWKHLAWCIFHPRQFNYNLGYFFGLVGALAAIERGDYRKDDQC